MVKLSLLTSPRSLGTFSTLKERSIGMSFTKARLPLASKQPRPTALKATKNPAAVIGPQPAAARKPGRPRKDATKAAISPHVNIPPVLQKRELRALPSRLSHLASGRASQRSPSISSVAWGIYPRGRTVVSPKPSSSTKKRTSTKKTVGKPSASIRIAIVKKRSTPPTPGVTTYRAATPVTSTPKIVVSKITKTRKTSQPQKIVLQKSIYKPATSRSPVSSVQTNFQSRSKQASHSKKIVSRRAEVIRCFCGRYAHIENFTMIQCDRCKEWHHVICVGKRVERWADPYICNRCRPWLGFATVRTHEETMGLLLNLGFST